MSAICSRQSHQMPHFSAKVHQIQFQTPLGELIIIQRFPRPARGV